MKHDSLKIFTFMIFLLHLGVVFINVMGWLFPVLRPLYQITLIVTILSWITTTSCLLTVWEFKLRKMINPKIEAYEYQFVDYYLRKIFKGSASPIFIHRVGLLFLVLSLGLNLITYGVAFL
ncbi:MAG: DUF2784 family protein [Candidatus Pacebacteria bacterium]|nr:DUF2784 family protein [Candidatus Paceibacterota bacterium]